MKKSKDQYRLKSRRRARAEVAMGSALSPERAAEKQRLYDRDAQYRRQARKNSAVRPSNQYRSPKFNSRYEVNRLPNSGLSTYTTIRRLSVPRVIPSMITDLHALGSMGYAAPPLTRYRGKSYFSGQGQGIVNLPASPASFDQLITGQSFVSQVVAERFGSRKLAFLTVLMEAVAASEFSPETADGVRLLERQIGILASCFPGCVIFASGFIEPEIHSLGADDGNSAVAQFVEDFLNGAKFSRSQKRHGKAALASAKTSRVSALPDANDMIYRPDGKKVWVVPHTHANVGVVRDDGKMLNYLQLRKALDVPCERRGILTQITAEKSMDQSRICIGEHARRQIEYAGKYLDRDSQENRMPFLSSRAAFANAGAFDFVLDTREVVRPDKVVDQIVEARRRVLFAAGLQHNHPIRAMGRNDIVNFYEGVGRDLNFDGWAKDIKPFGPVRHYDFKEGVLGSDNYPSNQKSDR